MRRAIVGLICLSSIISASHAEDMEDVIYKTDGSILRGELIEQDFAAGQYKIRLMGGSIFSVKQDDITKITKEPFIVQIPERALKTDTQPAVNVQVTQTGISNNNEQTSKPTPTINHYPVPNSQSAEEKRFPPHVISLGSTFRSYTHKYEAYDYWYGSTEVEETQYFDGYSIAYQANFTEHFSVYADYSKTEFRDVEISSDYGDYVLDGSDTGLDGLEITSIQSLAVLSTGNNVNRWQAAIGLGAFKDTAKLGGWTEDFKGTAWMLSGGYSWENLQLQLRYFGYNSKDYDFDTIDSLSLQLGVNL